MSHLQKVNDNGYSWYKCSCCPYGYHIDHDFVQYCESVTKEIDKCNETNKRRKDRRQKRQSMEVLLGITTTLTSTTTTTTTTTPLYENVTTNNYYQHYYRPQDHESKNYHTFDEAVSDFEKTLQRFKKNKTPHNNLPDVTAVSENIKRIPSPSSTASSHSDSSSMTVLPENTNNKDFDSISIESCGLSSLTLQNIREQMALSLERTRNLENQVKLIPELEAELLRVKEENKKLLLKLEKEKFSTLNNINANYLNYQNKFRSQSFTDIDSLENKKDTLLMELQTSTSRTPTPPQPPPRKDFGVMCGVLTRNVGVGHQNPNTKNVSTTTTINGNINNYTDKWYNEKIKFLNTQNNLIDKYKNVSVQTIILNNNNINNNNNKTVASQTINLINNNDKIKIDSYSQTTKKYFNDIGIIATPKYKDFTVQKTIKTVNIGVSNDNIYDINCEKCNIPKKTISIGTNDDLINKKQQQQQQQISLANLMLPRSKSFTLNNEKLNLNIKKRTIACQCNLNNIKTTLTKYSQTDFIGISKLTQYDIKNQTKSIQCDVKLNNKSTQYEYQQQILSSKLTDTKDLIILKNIGCETIKMDNIKKTNDVGCNTVEVATTTTTTTTPDSCAKCTSIDNKNKDNSATTPSRIPRPQVPTTPVEVRKFRRQDTYTKVYDRPLESAGTSELDLSPKSLEPTSPSDKIKEIDIENTINKVHVQENTLPLPETVVYHQSGQRKKCIPSKEMQAAMKVLNDCLKKNQTKIIKNTSAITLIQQEWFKISSLITANPLDVEDYLDCFDDISSLLLEYIVNMCDDSGNTAMHYAVSHGNFDVVSILLDSKVCDINKTNKAGYTCVMLVSLAEIRSMEHINVVKKMFQLADVNLRAKQHGQTALMLAVSHGRLDMVKMLLEAGADINIQDEDGSTALMCAAEHGHVDIVKHFLSHPDCNSTITDVDGSTALKIAMEAGHRHIGVLLYAHERNLQVPSSHTTTTTTTKDRKSKSSSPKTPSSPLPLRSSYRALTDTKHYNK